MKERIILAPGSNGTELLESLALHGINCIGVRICKAAELARFALMRSGVAVTEDFISIREEAALTAQAVAGEKYFGNPSYTDIREIASALRQMRCLAGAGEEGDKLQSILPKGIFTEKNAALLNVYQRYMDILSDRHALDSVSLIRMAIEKSKVLDEEFLTLNEYPLNPLEKALVDHLSGGNYRRSSLRELFGGKAFGICSSSAEEGEGPVPCAPDEDGLASGVSAGDGSVPCVSDKDVSVPEIIYKNCYGAPNEVETILADIYQNRTLDECTVAVTDTAMYSQLFFDYALLHDIPIAFGCGIPIMNSNPARLLSLYYNWSTKGLFGADALTDMLFSDAFDRKKFFAQCPVTEEGFSLSTFYDVLCGLRLTNDRVLNERKVAGFKAAVTRNSSEDSQDKLKEDGDIRKKLLCIPCLETAAEELSLPVEEFISKYVHIRKGNASYSQSLVMMLDRAAALAVFEELKVIRSSGAAQNVDDIIPNILKRNVCALRSGPGKLYVTGIDSAAASLRKHLYIAGLSASCFPGSPRENYLLLDADLHLFSEGAMPYTADGKILRRRESLLTMVQLASALGSTVCVSYSGLNVSELKRDNPSSLVYELLREQYGSSADVRELEKYIQKVGYFEPAISPSRLVGDAYTRGQEILMAGKEADSAVFEVRESSKGEAAALNLAKGEPSTLRASGEGDSPRINIYDKDKAWSPTALDIFFSCKRRFMLRYLLKIAEPDDYDPFQIISALDNGTMAHSLMEQLGKKNRQSVSRDEFVKMSGETFDRFILEHPPLIAENVPAVREQFLDMMETAYDMDPGREIALEEEDISCVHESGVRIHGFPDRVEKLEDGSYLIVDFKSGQRIAHVQDDITTCLQIVIYAYMMEQMGYKVSGGEYRYIRLGETVTCRYDEDMKKQLSNRLEEFLECMKNGTFPTPEPSEDGTDPCRFCKYMTICGKGEDSESSEEGGMS